MHLTNTFETEMTTCLKQYTSKMHMFLYCDKALSGNGQI